MAAPAPTSRRVSAPRPAETRKVIPFDYSFEFALDGRTGKTHRTKVDVSSEGPFTAVSIGYGTVLREPVINFGPGRADFVDGGQPGSLSEVTVGHLLAALNRVRGAQGTDVIRSGFRINPDLAGRALLDSGNASLDNASLENLFQVFVPSPDQVQFLYALFDDGSGRAFQSDPVLNIAGLGDAGGERPFRHFATPISFAPSATIRMEVTEVSTLPARLFVSLHGYKVLGVAGTPTGRAIQRGRWRR
jgi:hypothetical protein